MPRERQYYGFVISGDELAKHMNLPRDHRIVRVERPEGAEFRPQEIVVVVEGPGCSMRGAACPVHVHQYYERWRDEEVDFIREEALKQLGPYEW